ncbi:hypothetical protein EZ313_19400 [Ramlibacter henchirensis]|uniref:Uncharacterized protein n=1 Tax=Ramlibacter henchirensis TaxID=204072 RepID=A0A4Z0BP72_9BURK|nr:hypothetical protein [Ramlibacter henchirensis]TFZ00621.1 hypothetical protein EZ313_19400 [Ramlibacter henchirensis]
MFANKQPSRSQSIERVFNRIALRYGHYFLGRWDGIDLASVLEDWRQQLAGLSDEQLQYGLMHLPPGNPPDAGLFEQICRQMPQPARDLAPAEEVLSLEQLARNKQKAQEAVAYARQLLTKPRSRERRS